MRAPHPDFPHGLAYTKHAEISLEEMEAGNIVITDIPTSRIVWGERMTSVGHNLSREILRLRPDIGATIHVHDDATIALLRLRRAARFQGPVARSALRAGQAGAFRAGACRCRGRCQLRRRLHPGYQPRRAGRPRPHRARPQCLRGLSPAQHLHRRGAALPDGRAGRGAQGHDADLPCSKPRSRRCTASPSASSIRRAPKR